MCSPIDLPPRNLLHRLLNYRMPIITLNRVNITVARFRNCLHNTLDLIQSTRPWKKWFSQDQFCQNTTQTPNINTLRVPGTAQKNLWRPIPTGRDVLSRLRDSFSECKSCVSVLLLLSSSRDKGTEPSSIASAVRFSVQSAPADDTRASENAGHKGPDCPSPLLSCAGGFLSAHPHWDCCLPVNMRRR